MDSQEIAAAQVKAIQLIAAADGRIRQTYLAFRQSASLGSLQFTSKTFQIAEGIRGRYVQNGPNEYLNIEVRASEVIEPQPLQPKVPGGGAFLVVVTEWEPGVFFGETPEYNYQKNILKIVEPEVFASAIFAGGASIPVGVPIREVYTGGYDFTGITTAVYEPQLFFATGTLQTTIEIIATWDACFNDDKNVTTTMMTFFNPERDYLPFLDGWTGPVTVAETEQILQQAGYRLMYKSVISKTISGFMYISGYTDDLPPRPIYSVNSDFQRIADVTITLAGNSNIITTITPRSGTVSLGYIESGIGAI